MNVRLRPIVVGLALAASVVPVVAADTVRLAVTTTVENSGLAGVLIPQAEAATDTEIDTIVAGTGQAHMLARQGDIDMLITHAPEQEAALEAEGAVVGRAPLMVNDFVLVGPADDPAGVASATSPADAFRRLADAKAPFISRGDRSGTHVRELAIWTETGFDAETFGGWYRPFGAGMGAALNMAAAIGAYTMTDRATWMAFGNRGGLELLFEGSPPIDNPYAVMLVDPERHPHTAHAAASRVRDWLLGPEGQAAIGAFEIDGVQAFRPVRPQEGS